VSLPLIHPFEDAIDLQIWELEMGIRGLEAESARQLEFLKKLEERFIDWRTLEPFR
jgi:hypothetical protein